MNAKDQLILRIYDAALDAKEWPAVLQEVADYCRAAGAFVFEMQLEQGAQRLHATHCSANQNEAVLNAYLVEHLDDELADQNMFSDLSKNTDKIELIPDDPLVDHFGGENRMFARPHLQTQTGFGFRHRAGALLNKDDYFRDRIAFVFRAEHGRITREDLDLAEEVLPHLAKAINVARPSQQAQAANANLSTALDSLTTGVCVVDRHNRVVYQNPEFRRQVDRHGAFAVDRDGKLMPSRSKFDRSLLDLMANHNAHGKFGARPRKEAAEAQTALLPSEDGFALCVEVAPLTQPDGFGGERLEGYIIYSLDTAAAHAIDSGMVSKLYNLTRSEVEIVNLMAEGLTNAQMSERRNKSVHTVNTQVKAILAKTDVANRTQLIRLVTNLSMGMGGR